MKIRWSMFAIPALGSIGLLGSGVGLGGGAVCNHEVSTPFGAAFGSGCEATVGATVRPSRDRPDPAPADAFAPTITKSASAKDPAARVRGRRGARTAAI
jgi:hypothetical protein